MADSWPAELIDDLPTEIIERILAFAAAVDTRTAHAVCLTNRLGRKAGTAVLYHTVQLECDDDDQVVRGYPLVRSGVLWRDRMNAGLRKWSLICRTVLENRDLARHVRAINVHLIDIYYRNHRHELVAHSLHHDALLSLVKKELAEDPVNEDYIWKWLRKQQRSARSAERHEDGAGELGLIEGSPPAVFGPDVYLSILVLACPHAKSMVLSGHSYLRPINELAMALQRKRRRRNGLDWIAERGFGGFSSIEHVYFRPDDYKRGGVKWFADNVGSVLRWPSIKELTVENINSSYNIRPSLGSAFQSTLATLRLTNTSLGVDDFRPNISILLKPCGQLKTLIVSWSDGYDMYRDIDWRLLVATLQKFNPLLEELDLDVERREDLRWVFSGSRPREIRILDQAGQDETGQDETGQDESDQDETEEEDLTQINSKGLGSLAALKHLRRLSVPSFALFGVFDDVTKRDHEWTLAEILPSSLDELVLFAECAKFTDEDKALIGAPGTENLRKMTIWNCNRDECISKDDTDDGVWTQAAKLIWYRRKRCFNAITSDFSPKRVTVAQANKVLLDSRETPLRAVVEAADPYLM
jgi:hypothetical protein